MKTQKTREAIGHSGGQSALRERHESRGLSWASATFFTRLAAILVCVVGLSGGCATTQGTRTIHSLTVHSFRRDWTNAHLVIGPHGNFLVDAGLEANAAALDADLRGAGFDPAALRAIILSHGHADHAGGASYFQRRYGTAIVVGSGDEGMLASGHNERLCPTNDDARGRFDEDQNATFQGFTPNVVVASDLDLQPLTGVPGRIFRIPGHTEGSLAVVVQGAAFVGDLFRGTVFTQGADVHFYMCDLADNRSDIQRVLAQHAPTAQTFFVGHFGPLARSAVTDRFPPPLR